MIVFVCNLFFMLDWMLPVHKISFFESGRVQKKKKKQKILYYMQTEASEFSFQCVQTAKEKMAEKKNQRNLCGMRQCCSAISMNVMLRYSRSTVHSPDVHSIKHNPHKTLTRVDVIKTLSSAIICIMLF